MIHRLVVSCLLAVVAAQQTDSQPSPLGNALLSGWLSEALDRDFGKARASYERAIADEALAPELRVVAAARLLELVSVTEGGGWIEQRLLQFRLPRLPNVGPAFEERGRLRMASKALGAALREPEGATREAQIQAARDELLAYLADRPQLETRPWVPRVINALAGSGLEAREPHAGRRAPPVQQPPRHTRTIRLQAAQCVLHRLEGRNVLADRLANNVRARIGDSRPAGEPPKEPPEARLVLALQILRESLVALRLDTLPEERTALTRLEKHLLMLQAQGKASEAIELLQRLPIYDRWLLGEAR
jgi:hypothetical protein